MTFTQLISLLLVVGEESSGGSKVEYRKQCQRIAALRFPYFGTSAWHRLFPGHTPSDPVKAQSHKNGATKFHSAFGGFVRPL